VLAAAVPSVDDANEAARNVDPVGNVAAAAISRRPN